MARSTDSLTLQAAAERLGVHYMTVYRYVRLGLLPATKEGGSWRVDLADLKSFKLPTPGRRSSEPAPWSDRLEARMVAGDLNGAWGVVEAALASGTEPAEVYQEILSPALESIGRRWADGELAVEDEHLASAVAARLIGRMGSRFNRRGRSRGTVIAAMPPGDRHAMAVAMVSDVLRGAGYEVLDLGADTPVASLEAAIRRTDAVRAVCVSVVYEPALEAAAAMVAAAKAMLGPDTPVLVGGGAVVDAERARELGADGYAPDVATLVEVVGESG